MAGLIRREIPTAARPLSLRDIHAQAEAMLEAARRGASKIRSDAEAEAAMLRAQAVREGHAEGHAAGQLEGRRTGEAALEGAVRTAAERQIEARVAALADALGAALDSFETQKRRLLAASESGIVAIACEVARRVCGSLPLLSSDVVCGTVQRVVELMRHEHDLRLRVHPDEFEIVQRFLPDFLARLGKMGHVTLSPDPGMARGGCVIEGRYGLIDADIDTQLRRVAEQLIGAAYPPQQRGVEASVLATTRENPPDSVPDAGLGRFEAETRV